MASNCASAAAAMVGGDVDHSYAKNSSYQRAAVDAAKELIHESISEKLDLEILGFDAWSTIKIADLGCSVGPNTFFAMQNIMEAIEPKLFQAQNINPSSLEFQVFFNDHEQNDFNTLFRTLPPSRKYFAAGVPGSFHGRLFPKSSLHFAHISSALHWLSRIPKDIIDKNSPAWNKGSIQCTDQSSNQEVFRAYSTQFKNDMESFLNARAEELVPGGLIFISATIIPNGMAVSDTLSGACYDVLGSCLDDLAKMGALSEEKVDSFNLPKYAATPTEFDAIIKTNGKFSVEKMEKFTRSKSSTPITPKGLALGGRAITDGFIRNHFGDEFADQIFNHFNKKMEENFSKIKEKNNFNIFVSLKRIAN